MVEHSNLNNQKKSGINILMRKIEKLLILLGIFNVLLLLNNHISLFYSLKPHYLSCGLASIFNCKDILSSDFSTIFTIPLPIYGLVFFLMYCFGNRKILSIINLIGSIILFLISIIKFQNLCLYCSFHYLIAFGLFYFNYKKPFEISTKTLINQFIVFAIIISSYLFIINYWQDKNFKLYVIEDFHSKENVELYMYSNQRPYDNFPTFEDAPMHITVFSDFECPACKVFASRLSKLNESYPKTINVQYFHYPMDLSCNNYMFDMKHKWSCAASYLSLCYKDNFFNIYKEFFDNQDLFSEQYFEDIVNQGLIDKKCLSNFDTLNYLSLNISMAKELNIESTPLVIINGKMYKGAVPYKVLSQLAEYFRSTHHK